MQVTGVTLANATGVRLEFFKAGSTGLLKEDYYTPPPILEPGEVASFLVDNSVEFKLNYNIQTFQGPLGRLQAGWVAGDPDKTVTVMGQDGFSTTIDATLQVDRGKAFPPQFIFDVSPTTTAAHPASSVTHLPSEPICPRYGPPAMHSPPSSRATTPAHDYA